MYLWARKCWWWISSHPILEIKIQEKMLQVRWQLLLIVVTKNYSFLLLWHFCFWQILWQTEANLQTLYPWPSSSQCTSKVCKYTSEGKENSEHLKGMALFLKAKTMETEEEREEHHSIFWKNLCSAADNIYATVLCESYLFIHL